MINMMLKTTCHASEAPNVIPVSKERQVNKELKISQFAETLYAF